MSAYTKGTIKEPSARERLSAHEGQGSALGEKEHQAMKAQLLDLAAGLGSARRIA